MKKINKKILYGMGAISIVASPIIAVVACGAKAPVIKLSKITPIIDIDLDKIESPTKLIQRMNESMHFISKDPSTIVGKPVDDAKTNDNYPLTKKQYQEIGAGVITDQNFTLTYKGKSTTIISNFNKDTMIVKNSIEEMLKN
jgi:hypothetical protein